MKEEKICSEEQTVEEQQATEPDTTTDEADCPAAGAEQQQALQETLQEMEHRLLRLQADFDNYRKRTQRERLEQAVLAEAALVSNLLPVLDNFDRALANLPEAGAAWAEGVQLVYRQLLDVLQQQGLELIDCQRPFDPNVHEAVMRETCDSDVEDGTILQEFQKGYMYKGKLLRPSKVKVAARG